MQFYLTTKCSFSELKIKFLHTVLNRLNFVFFTGKQLLITLIELRRFQLLCGICANLEKAKFIKWMVCLLGFNDFWLNSVCQMSPFSRTPPKFSVFFRKKCCAKNYRGAKIAILITLITEICWKMMKIWAF